MCLADSYLFTCSILQYYDKVLIVGTDLLLLCLETTDQPQDRAFVPGVIFTPLLSIFKILYNKIGDMLCSMY